MRSLLVCLALLSATGCVSQKKYRALKSDYQSLSSDYSDLQAQNNRQSEKLAALESQVEELRMVEEELAAFYQGIIEDFRPMIEKGYVDITIHDGRLQLSLNDQILFDTAEAELNPEGRQVLGMIADMMRANPDREFQIEGHTDPRPIHTARYESNWDLGADRATEVVEALVQSGVSPTQISAASFAQYQPVNSNADDLGMRENRRVDIVMIPDFNSMPESQAMLEEVRSIRTAALNNGTNTGTTASAGTVNQDGTITPSGTTASNVGTND